MFVHINKHQATSAVIRFQQDNEIFRFKKIFSFSSFEKDINNNMTLEFEKECH